MPQAEITTDARRRTSLAKVGRPGDHRYLVDEFEDGSLLLTPAVTLAASELAALEDPQIREALDKTLQPSRSKLKSRGSFARHAR